MARPTLILQTVCFDDSDYADAYQLGGALYNSLTRPADNALSYGPGILVFSGVRPEHVDLEAAETLVLLPVLGQETYLLDQEAVLENIARWHEKLGAGHVIPIPTSANWRAAEDRLPGKNLLTELYGKENRRQRTVDEIVLATLRLFEKDGKKAQLFVSHSKADMKATGEAAMAVHEYVVNDTTGSAFFDVNDLAAGQSLEEQIDKEVSHGVFVMMRTDAYSSRSWCQKELLVAKRHGLPTLRVDILEKGESLGSAYAGNGPSILWEKGNPEAVVSRAMVECLRAAHFREESKRIKELASLPADTISLCRPPELLDLVQGPLNIGQSQMVIHPDPELPVVIRDLLAVANPRLKLVTPTTAYRRIGGQQSTVANPFDELQVAMSLSDSPSVDGEEGYTDHHIVDATVYLARCLISAGAHIAYGGDFRPGGYTEILSDLVSAYRQAAGGDPAVLHGYVGAVLKLSDASDNVQIRAHHMGRGSFKKEALLPPPADDLDQDLWGLYFSDMRRAMARHTQAHVVLGGGSVPRIDDKGSEQAGYTGRYPGVVEEAWRSLEIGQPLYVVGGYGGAAGLVADLIEGKKTPAELMDETWTKFDSFRQRAEKIDASPYREQLGVPETMKDLADAVRQLSAGLLQDDASSVAWNGLTLAENRELRRTRDPMAIASLIFNGLQKVRRQKIEGKLEIELVEGSITAARDIDAVAVGVFDDLPLGGAGAALDRLVAGRASLARAEGEALISLDSNEIAADWLYLASLGPLEELNQLPERIQEASSHTADLVKRHGFSRLGVVAFGGTMLDDMKKTTSSMVDGLIGLAGQTVISWFETDRRQFAALLETLKQDERVNVTTRSFSEAVPAAPRVQQEQLVLSVALTGDRLTSIAVPPSGTGVARTQEMLLTAEMLKDYSKGSGSGRRTPNQGALDERVLKLAHLLLGEDSSELLSRCRDSKVMIIHDIPSSRLPFEILLGNFHKEGDEEQEADAIRPAVIGGINRRLAINGVSLEQLLAKPPHTGKLKVLLVVNPLGDLAGAEVEAKAVKEILEENGDSIELIELWNKEATRDAFLDRIKQADVLHYCGHAFYDGPGAEESGLNLWGDPLYLSDLADQNSPVRLVFANACESGRVRAKSPIASEAASFAEFFLRSGIEAYLGTYWQVSDTAAAAFSTSVYGSLVGGDSLDKAVRSGREKLKAKGESEWANYILYGDGRFQLIAG
jgi:CHAT domain-containing protein